MELLDLPLELIQTIIKLLVNTTTRRREIFRFREIDSELWLASQSAASFMKRFLTKWIDFFARQVELEFVKSRSDLTIPHLTTEDLLIYEKDRPSEAEIFSTIRNGLLAPRGSICFSYTVCAHLRPSVAVLMGTPELQFPDIPGDAEVESEGFLEDHSDVSSQARFIRIVESVAATFIYSEGLEGVIDLLPAHSSCTAWFWRGSTDPLEWATATAVLMENLPTAKVLLRAYARFKPDEGPELVMEWGDDELLFGRWYMANILILATQKCSYEMVSLVLENKACINAERPHLPRETALEIACQRGSLRLVTLILNPRWDLCDYNENYLRAIHNAAQCGCSYRGTQECDERMSIIILLTDRKAIADAQDLKQNVLAEACKWGCPNITRMMLDAGANPNARGRRQTYTSALIHAASHGHVELMEYLLERGARNISVFFPSNSVKFVKAAANQDMITYLSDRDARIMLRGPLEHSKAEFILKIASIKNCARVVKLLIWAGFDLRTGNRGVQALQDALSNASADVVEVLRS